SCSEQPHRQHRRALPQANTRERIEAIGYPELIAQRSVDIDGLRQCGARGAGCAQSGVDQRECEQSTREPPRVLGRAAQANAGLQARARLTEVARVHVEVAEVLDARGVPERSVDRLRRRAGPLEVLSRLLGMSSHARNPAQLEESER